MRKKTTTIAAYVALTLFSGATASLAQSRNPPAAAYEPGLGDLMTTTVQPRHIKIALAAREKNWAYAGYEFNELNEAFGRAVQVWPQWQSKPIKDMLASVMKQPMTNLGQAIKNKDATKFSAAYDQLTAGCNACHQAAGRGMVAIKTPDTSSYPDQDFSPAKQ
jgi:hypothetical protein